MKMFLGWFQAASHNPVVRFIVETVDRILKLKALPLKSLTDYSALPLTFNSLEEREAIWPLAELQSCGSFRDTSGQRRAKESHDKFERR
ncbi:MAG: hypothetical protein HQK56_01405 [Deltaproteobacteria bacterium]|nr:hypothetical protein [Deltaproteobacteria bacterium]